MTRQEALQTGLPLAINGGGYDSDDNRPEHVEDPQGPSIKVTDAPVAPTVVPTEEPVEMGWVPPTPEVLAAAAATQPDDVDVVLATIERIEQKLRKRLDPRIMQRLEALEKLLG